MPWEWWGLRGTVREAPPMFLLLLGETMGRDCTLVYGVSDRTPSCWGSCVGPALEGWRGGRRTIRVRFCLGATGGLDDRSPGMFGRRYRS